MRCKFKLQLQNTVINSVVFKSKFGFFVKKEHTQKRYLIYKPKQGVNKTQRHKSSGRNF